MSVVEDADKQLVSAMVASAREHDGWPGEADSTINNASRSLIAAMLETHGRAFLGNINLDGKARQKNGGTIEGVVWEHFDGVLVYNFGADFVLPADDAELRRLIWERDADYRPAEESNRIATIIDRAHAAGGKLLFWT